MVHDLVSHLRIEQFVELPHIKGTTTEFLAESSRRTSVHGGITPTVLLRPRTQIRLEYPSVTVQLGDSRSFLRHMASNEALCGAPYPLLLRRSLGTRHTFAGRVAVILNAWRDAVVVIDDFEVPGDSGYAFDDYGMGRRICIDYLPEMPGWILFFPSVHSGLETGARRGCAVVVSPSMSLDALSVPTLRPNYQ